MSDGDLNAKHFDAQSTMDNIWRDENTPEKNLKAKSNKSNRKRKRRYSSTDEDELDTSIDAKLKQSAMRNNLTPQNVKNILQKVVRNDHVLAIVKLKEEELERREQAKKESKTMSETSDENIPKSSENDGIVDSENSIPKLTRAKAKALNKYPLPVAPLKQSQPDSEVVALINEELHSDDDDEEYQPGEDDIESDDDINTTASDIDSQPATPLSQVDTTEECQTIYTNDGLFKIPHARNDSSTSQIEQEYIIAQRTRSKISLAETPIEAIESTFKAPDAPIDMYQVEQDVDPNWIQFLSNFSMPLTSEIEKDEDTDPDYCPMVVDSQPDDREEFQDVNVSKKEFSDLLNDWYSCVDINFLDLTDFDPITLDSNSSKQQPNVQDDLNESLVTPVKQIDEPLTMSDRNKIQSQAKSQPQSSDQSPLSSYPGISYFDPSVISTPAKPNVSNMSNSSMFQSNQSFDSFNSTLLSMNEPLAHCAYSSYSYPTNAYAFAPLQEKSSPVFLPVMTFTTNSNVQPNNAPLTNNTILITIPSDVSATTPAMPTTVLSSMQLNDIGDNIRQQIEAGPVQKKTKRPGCRSKVSRFRSAAYKGLENIDPNSIEPQYFISPDERGFTSQQRLILEKQLRMHVQLTTQSFIQTYGHPEFYSEANKFKQYLIEFENIIDKKHATHVSIYNLKPAIELITKWENDLSENTKENSELFEYIQKEMNKLRKNVSYTMQFHERILRLICHSKVFMYPELLPAIPFRLKTSKPSEYYPTEDFLLAFLLEHFYEDLQRKITIYKFAKPKEVTLTSVCHHISAHLNYLRHWKSIYDYIRLRRDGELFNPIKFYFKHKRAPPIRHSYEETFNPNTVIEPAKQPLNKLSTQWSRFVEKLIGFYNDEIFSKINAPVSEKNKLSKEQTKPKSNTKRTKISNTNEFIVQHSQNNTYYNQNDSLIQVKIVYERSDTTQIPNLSKTENAKFELICNKRNDNNECLIKGQTLLTSYFHPISKKHFENQTISANLDDENIEINKKCLLRLSKQIRRKYNRLKIQQYIFRQKIIHLLVHLALKLRKNFSSHWYRFRRNKKVSFVYHCFRTFYQFLSEFENCAKYQSVQVSSKMSTEALVTNRRVQKILNENANHTKEINDENNAHSAQQHHSDGGVKRLPKNQRTNDSTRLLLLADNVQESSEKDFLFAQRFLDRVEETFISENKHHKFSEFLSILRDFNENQHQQTGAELYSILEKFMPDYPELLDLFLNFLLPSDAVEINKSMEYFLNVNLAKFLNKLNVFFQKQPAQIRKILACLKELSQDPDVSIDRIRSKVLPLLKGNQLLIDWFLQCVGPDKCESSKDEYETLVLRKGNESFDDDQFEYIPQSEILPDPNDNPCHIRYMNGRLFYGSRFPLPAKLSFSALPCTSVTCDSVETDKQFLTESIDKGLHYHCVHNIKEFADSKMRDRHHTDIEQNSNCDQVTEEVENSDEEHQCLTLIGKIDDRNSNEEDAEYFNATIMNDTILCDNTLLRAHSIRLNPSLHSTSLVHSNADILNKLKSPEILSADNVNKELKLSPKKQSVTKSSANTHAKQSQVRKNTSPNTKKVGSGVSSKSPNSKKTTSSFLSVPQSMEGCSFQSIQESNAIQTAKKLQRILETNDQSSASCQLNQIDDVPKCTNQNIVSSIKLKVHKSHMLSKPIKKQKRAHEFYDSGDDEEIVDEFVEKDDPKVPIENNSSQKINTQSTEIQWTREEDRLLLEQIKAGLDSNMENITEFADQFPNKTQDQIRNRIDFLIDFLTKLRNKNS